jgi:AcrR family transcriptional regulator
MQSSRGNRAPVFLKAAQELFFAKGYAGTTMEQVSRRAGFSKRTVYLYFKNKDDLFLAVASQGLEWLQAGLEDVDVEGLEYEVAVDSIMDRYIRFAADSPEYFRFIFHDATQDMIANASESVRERIAGQERACLRVPARVVEKAVAEGIVPPVDPREAAIVFWGTVTGIILLSLGGSQTVLPDNRPDIIRRAVRVLYHGFKNLPGLAAPKEPEDS